MKVAEEGKAGGVGEILLVEGNRGLYTSFKYVLKLLRKRKGKGEGDIFLVEG